MSKEKIIDLIDEIYDEDDLWEIYMKADRRLERLRKYRLKTINESSIIKEVKEAGFMCLVTPIEIKETGILSMDLYANVYVYTFRKVNKEDLVISRLSNNDGTWVEELDFDCICEYDQLILPESSQEWDSGNYGDPFNAIAKFKVQVLYIQKDFPDKDFRYIDSSGIVKTMNVKDNKLYTENKYFGDVNKWDTYKLFVL